jgi:uncharacterized protein DUF5681
MTEIGYKRPPRHTQFRPGQSGNPHGRPRGTQNLATDLTEELALRVTIRDGDRRRLVSKQRALIMALISRGLAGDSRAIGVLLQLLVKMVGPVDRTAPKNEELSADDQAILDEFLDRELRARQAYAAKPNR